LHLGPWMDKLFIQWNSIAASEIRLFPRDKIKITEALAQKKTTMMRIVGILDIEDNQT